MDDQDQCQVEQVDKPIDREAVYASTVAYLFVKGMGCPRCAQRVQNSLLKLDGVLLAQVNLEGSYAAAAYDPQRIQPVALLQAVANAGGNDGKHRYTADLIREAPANEVITW